MAEENEENGENTHPHRQKFSLKSFRMLEIYVLIVTLGNNLQKGTEVCEVSFR